MEYIPDSYNSMELIQKSPSRHRNLDMSMNQSSDFDKPYESGSSEIPDISSNSSHIASTSFEH